MTLMQKALDLQFYAGDTNAYAIYRLRANEANERFLFLGYDEHDRKIAKENYSPIYIGELREGQQLEDLYAEFNLHHPEDFHSYSMSVGDVIIIRYNKRLSAYFIDRIGFKELPDFIDPVLPRATSEQLPPLEKQTICPMCGESHLDSKRYCARCAILEASLGGQMTIDALVGRLWDYCPACSSDAVSSAELLTDSFVIRCDDCSEVYAIPFSIEDILRYLRVGITAETEEE